MDLDQKEQQVLFLALWRLFEGVKDSNISAIIIFIDLKMAFHTIHRGKLI